MKTETAVKAYTERIAQQEAQIQQLKFELGDAQRATDVARTTSEYFQGKYEGLILKNLKLQERVAELTISNALLRQS